MNMSAKAAPEPERIKTMFDGIAGRYDLMNSVISAGRHHQWRRLAVAATALAPGMTALDVCCGTGDMAFALADRVGPAGKVTGVDFSPRMLEIAKSKAKKRGQAVEFRHGDATRLEFKPGSFDACAAGFGVRNIPQLADVFSEMNRVVRPGGRIVCLEITRPVKPPFRQFYRLWFDAVVPALGRMISRHESAYSYLPASVRRFPPAPGLAAVMRKAGIKQVEYRLLAGGIIALHWGRATKMSNDK